MSLENTAIDAKDSLKKAIKEGKTNCASIATLINKIIDQALWEYLTIPGETAADKLHNLITLPYGQGGLNTTIDQMDALLSFSTPTQRRFRLLAYQAKPGNRNDLKPQPKEDKVDALLSPGKKPAAKSPGKKPKKLSSSQIATERAADRAAKAVPQIEKLLDEGLVAKNVAAKVGQVVKNKENPTEKEKATLENRKQIQEKLSKILPDPLPEDPKQREKLRKEVKQVIENTSGLKSKVKVAIQASPEDTAKAIAKANPDVDYLQQLKVAIDFEIEDLQQANASKAKKPRAISGGGNKVSVAAA